MAAEGYPKYIVAILRKKLPFYVSYFRITDEEATYRVFKIGDISVLGFKGLMS